MRNTPPVSMKFMPTACNIYCQKTRKGNQRGEKKLPSYHYIDSLKNEKQFIRNIKKDKK